jgi:hypothetical protein
MRELDHVALMREAIAEAELARGSTGDNPWVGCVLVNARGDRTSRRGARRRCWRSTTGPPVLASSSYDRPYGEEIRIGIAESSMCLAGVGGRNGRGLR